MCVCAISFSHQDTTTPQHHDNVNVSEGTQIASPVNTPRQHDAGVGANVRADARVAWYPVISAMCFSNHSRSKFISLLPTMHRCMVNNSGRPLYLQELMACLMVIFGKKSQPPLGIWETLTELLDASSADAQAHDTPGDQERPPEPPLSVATPV
jgi:hypothetical protein